MRLDINSEAGLKALQGLHRLGCLGQLRKAELTANISDPTTGGHLALLGACSTLQELVLVYDFKPGKLWWWDPYVTVWAERITSTACDFAEYVNLIELASTMPVRVQRDIRTYKELDVWDECFCGFVTYTSEDDDLDPHILSNRSNSSNSTTKERCTCYDRAWSWGPGEPAKFTFPDTARQSKK